MSATAQNLIDDVTNEGSFDASSAQILRWLDRRHKMMCARAKCIRETRTLASPVSVNGVTTVAVPGVVELYEVIYTDTGGNVSTFASARHTDLAAYRESQLVWAGADGLFYREGSSLSLFPLTVGSGTITAEAAWEAGDLATNTVLSVDDEALEGLLAGVFATALSRPQEARTDLAAAYEQQFAGACEELRQRTVWRLKGRGTGAIRMAPGYHPGLI